MGHWARDYGKWGYDTTQKETKKCFLRNKKCNICNKKRFLIEM
jgi:hypothetical protein